MHDLRLVGVHEDGEHLLLSDAEGRRFLLGVDDALRAAVRRDRPHLGQLQIEIEGGLRPRDVQARIRAGATAEEVAALAGWPVEKVRRYEGPVLAEREHVAGIAREVRLRRRGGSVTLGAEVSRRLTARGVDLDQVTWDSWRVDGDPWTVVVTFPAGGRDRSARWHLDIAGHSVTPGDDEARWLSEDQPEGEGPLAGARLSAVPLSPAGTSSGSHVYDVEVDGGMGPSDIDHRSGPGEALDLVGAMRARRQANRAGRRRAGGSDPAAHGDGPTSTHPAGRRRSRQAHGVPPEPLELDPSLMNDPPAAHPPASEVDDAAALDGPAGATPAAEAAADRPITLDAPATVTALPSVGTLSPVPRLSPLGVPEDSTSPSPRHWPLVEAMRRQPAPALLPRVELDAADPSTVAAPGTTSEGAPSDTTPSDATPSDATPSDAGMSTGRHRDERDSSRTGSTGGSARRSSTRGTKRASVPSWDDIMFGAKQD